jgi:hypothetical protein
MTCEGPLQLLHRILVNQGYQVHFLKEMKTSFPEPEFILFSGDKEELSLWNKKVGNIPIFLLNSISPSYLHLFLDKPIYPLVFIFYNGKMEGMILGLDYVKRVRNFRKVIRDFVIPFMVLGKVEAFLMHFFYDHWEEGKGFRMEELNQYSFAFRCDGVHILRGLGLDSRIGQVQVSALPKFSEKKWRTPILFHLIKEMGGENIVCWKNGPDFSRKDMDLLLIINKDEDIKQMKAETWKKYRHIFRQPHIIDCVNLYEPEELNAVGYKYLSLFRYKYLINGEE